MRVAPGVYREHGLVISTVVEIDGAGPKSTIIDAGGKGQAVLVHSAGVLTVNGVTIRNGNSAAHAGAIENSGTLTLLNDKFIGNSAVDPGGAIVNYSVITSMDNDRFINNTSQSYGGAITNFGTIGTAAGDDFANNLGENGGGAINNAGSIEMLDDSTFRSNEAGYAGGVYNDGTIGDMSSDTFWNNNVTAYGGAMVNVFGNIKSVDNDTFVGNSVNDSLGQGGRDRAGRGGDRDLGW